MPLGAAGELLTHPCATWVRFGGSLAFADPAADYLTVLTAAEAVVECASARGRRLIPIGSFVTDWYATALTEDEVVTAVLVPPSVPRSSAHYEKLARVRATSLSSRLLSSWPCVAKLAN